MPRPGLDIPVETGVGSGLPLLEVATSNRFQVLTGSGGDSTFGSVEEALLEYAGTDGSDTPVCVGEDLHSQEDMDLRNSGLLAGSSPFAAGSEAWSAMMGEESSMLDPDVVMDASSPGYPSYPGQERTETASVEESTLNPFPASTEVPVTVADMQTVAASSLGLGKTCTETNAATAVVDADVARPSAHAGAPGKRQGSRRSRGQKGSPATPGRASPGKVARTSPGKYTPETATVAQIASRFKSRWSALPVRCRQMPGVYGFFELQVGKPGYTAMLRFPYATDGDQLKCPHCDATFTGAKCLIRHVLGNHYPWTTRYCCPVEMCQSPGLLRKADLGVHLKTRHLWEDEAWTARVKGQFSTVPAFNDRYMPPNPAKRSETPFSFNLQVAEDAQLLARGVHPFPLTHAVELTSARTQSSEPGVLYTSLPLGVKKRKLGSSPLGPPPGVSQSSGSPVSTATATVATSGVDLPTPGPAIVAGPQKRKRTRKRKLPSTSGPGESMELDPSEVAPAQAEEVEISRISPLVTSSPKSPVPAPLIRITGQVISNYAQALAGKKKKGQKTPPPPVLRKPGKLKMGEFLCPDSSRPGMIAPSLKVPTHSGSASASATPVRPRVAQVSEVRELGAEYAHSSDQLHDQALIATRRGDLRELQTLRVRSHQHHVAAMALQHVGEEARKRAHEVMVETGHNITLVTRQRTLEAEKSTLRASLENQVTELKTQVRGLQAQLRESDARSRRDPPASSALPPVFGSVSDSEATVALLTSEREIFRSAFVDVMARIAGDPGTAVHPDMLTGEVRVALRNLPSSEATDDVRTSTATLSSLYGERTSFYEEKARRK